MTERRETSERPANASSTPKQQDKDDGPPSFFGLGPLLGLLVVAAGLGLLFTWILIDLIRSLVRWLL